MTLFSRGAGVLFAGRDTENQNPRVFVPKHSPGPVPAHLAHAHDPGWPVWSGLGRGSTLFYASVARAPLRWSLRVCFNYFLTARLGSHKPVWISESSFPSQGRTWWATVSYTGHTPKLPSWGSFYFMCTTRIAESGFIVFEGPSPGISFLRWSPRHIWVLCLCWFLSILPLPGTPHRMPRMGRAQHSQSPRSSSASTTCIPTGRAQCAWASVSPQQMEVGMEFCWRGVIRDPLILQVLPGRRCYYHLYRRGGSCCSLPPPKAQLVTTPWYQMVCTCNSTGSSGHSPWWDGTRACMAAVVTGRAFGLSACFPRQCPQLPSST